MLGVVARIRIKEGMGEQFEEVATARSYGDLEVRRAVIKLGRAWTA